MYSRASFIDTDMRQAKVKDQHIHPRKTIPMSTHTIATQPGTSLAVDDWERTDYADALTRQLQTVEARRANQIPDQLILTEHHPVFTIGLRQGADQHLVWSAEHLQKAGIQVVRTNRGGDITYHGPGQLVVYPVVSLHDRRDLHHYLRDLEEVVIRTLAHWRLDSGRREGKTGIWLEDRKICAIGVAVKSWVTYHGLALNVDPDLNHFTGIIPCGITDGRVTALRAELPTLPPLADIKSRLAVEFAAVFGKTLLDYGSA
jgi:lipoyl(octanoyl) transferase